MTIFQEAASLADALAPIKTELHARPLKAEIVIFLRAIAALDVSVEPVAIAEKSMDGYSIVEKHFYWTKASERFLKFGDTKLYAQQQLESEVLKVTSNLRDQLRAAQGREEIRRQLCTELEARLNETHTDEQGTVWTVPTAWAYFAACRALNEHKAEADSLRKLVSNQASAS